MHIEFTIENLIENSGTINYKNLVTKFPIISARYFILRNMFSLESTHRIGIDTLDNFT